MDVLQPIVSLNSQILDLPPSCVQFCPAHPEYLVVGTYNLEKEGDAPASTNGDDESGSSKPRNRNGSLIVFKIDGNKLNKVQTLSQPSALLDLRFNQNFPEYRDLLAAISSTGTLAVFKLDPVQDSEAPLKHLVTSRCEDLAEDVLFLQCNWHPAVRKVIGVTTSTGVARLLHLDEKWRINSSTDVGITNSLEAWCIGFSPVSSTTDGRNAATSVYCGGDDSMLRYATCSWNDNNDDGSPPISIPYTASSLKGQHDAGVTAILPLDFKTPQGGRVIITGSYDDHLRVFSIHDLHESHGLKRIQMLTETNLGGGVWRLDLIDTRTGNGASKLRILASCMYAGARLVELVTENGLDWSCSVLARFEEHKSMNYASDIVPSLVEDNVDKVRVVSTSFYDKLLCLWEYDARL